MKKSKGNGKVKAFAMFLAVVLAVTGIDLPFAAGTLQVAAKEETSGMPEQNMKEAEIQQTEQNAEGADGQEPAPQADPEGTEKTEETGEPEETPAVPDLSGISGEGTEASPYQIASIDNLVTFREYVNAGGETAGKYFSLTEDVTVEDDSSNSFDISKLWRPIGTSEHPFAGTFRGVDGKKLILHIGGMNIQAEKKAELAVFGENTGTIENLTVERKADALVDGIGVHGSAVFYASGIALKNAKSGVIRGCTVKLRIRTNTGGGGIVGENEGLIADCKFGSSEDGNGRINATSKEWEAEHCYGGIAGKNLETGRIENCQNYMMMVGSNETYGCVGGIAGYNAGSIVKCENYADIVVMDTSDDGFTKEVGIGGIVGVQKTTGKLESCFHAGWMSKKSGNTAYMKQGLIFGRFEDAYIPAMQYTENYKVTSELQKALRTGYSNITDCTFWRDPEDDSSNRYIWWGVGMVSNPQFIGKIYGYSEDSVAAYAPGITITSQKTKPVTTLTGEGTKESPYLISTEADLTAFRNYVNDGGAAAYTRLEADLTVTDSKWVGIGTKTQPFFGEFDGNGHSVTVAIDKGAGYDGENEAGLFGYNCGTIKGLTVKGSIKANRFLGAVAAVNGDYAGIEGLVYTGVIQDCHNEAEIQGQSFAGGIAGVNLGSTQNIMCEKSERVSRIEDCTNSGSVSVANDSAGGIVGYHKIGKLIGCENTAEIAGHNTVGGITGDLFGDLNDVDHTLRQVVQRCRNTGNVKFVKSYEDEPDEYNNIGAIAGQIDTGIKVEGIFVDCYYKMDANTNYQRPGVGNKELKQYEGAITYDEMEAPAPVEPSESLEGAGTETEPYVIKNLNDFLYFAQNNQENQYYKLTADIDLKGSKDNQWTPVNEGKKSFVGILDGDGHTIKGLYIDRASDGKEQGLFAINSGTIKNLTVEGTVKGNDTTGGIAASSSESGNIINCISRVTVEGTSSTGGIAGVNKGNITDCISKAAVSGKYDTGGIAGENRGNIESCVNEGAVSMDGESVDPAGQLGGIAGNNLYANSKPGRIKNCINRGDVTATGMGGVQGEARGGCIGGIAGSASALAKDALSGCINDGNVSGKRYLYVGGIVGASYGCIVNNTNNGEVLGQECVGGIAGLQNTTGADAFMRGNSNNGEVVCSGSGGINLEITSEDYGTALGGVVGSFLFNSDYGEEYSYQNNRFLKNADVNKFLRAIGSPMNAAGNDGSSESAERLPNPGKLFVGEGTEETPYEIGSRETLEKLRDLINEGDKDYTGKHYVITNDIDLGGSEKNPWTPIGSEDHPFTGTIDGNGHTVSGLYINDEKADNQGLFGVNSGTIQNVRAEGTVTGHDNVGGLVGTNAKDGIITGCATDVIVTGNNYVGGIAGKNEGKIENCTAGGSVTGNDYVGGIAGSNGPEGTIKDSANNGNVSKKDGSEGTYIGGIAGDNQNPGSGSVTGTYVKNEDTNKDIQGIGGQTSDPSGVTSSETPVPEPGKDFVGKGTPEKPYQIYTADGWKKFQEAVENKPDVYKGASFELKKDIALPADGQKPVGSADHPFTGTLKGNGHTISGLNINNESADNQGLFGVNAGTIENLIVKGSVTGKDNVGGITGTNTETGVIRACTTDVTVKGNNNVGGIAGKNEGKISDCTSRGSVSGKDNVGGIAGTNTETGFIKDSISNAEVTGENNTGGIVGNNEGEVVRCATKTDGKTESGSGSETAGSVTGSGANTGGITGTNTGTVKDSTNNADVTGGTSNTGGVTGSNGTGGTVTGSGNNGNVTTTGDSADTTGALIGKNDNNTSDAVSGSYKKDDTTNKDLTGIGSGTGSGTDPEGVTAVTDGDVKNPQKPFEGSGTKEDPYKIKTEDDLKKLAELVNSGENHEGDHFKIESESGITLTEKSKPWTPIGTEEHPFKGNFDGDNKTVSGLETTDKTADNQGLFGVNAGTIENLTVEGTVTGKDNVGGIAGTNTENGTIKNCTSDVTVTGENNAGGIVGKNDGTVTDCTNKGAVTGTGSNTGGITGDNKGTVQDNTNQGTVSGKDNTGGIAGTNENGGVVKNNTNEGDVTGSGSNTGGIAGNNQGTVQENKNEGTVKGTDNTGGITGTNESNGKLNDNTNSGNVTGSGSNTGGITGDNKGNIQDNKNQGTVGGTDNTGGIAGTNGTGGVVKNNTNEGSVTGTGSNTGGVIGENQGTVQGNKNEGTVNGKDNTGGITGSNDGIYAQVKDNANEGSVTGSGDNTGGITGSNGRGSQVKDNTNGGNVTGSGSNTGGITGTNNGTVQGSKNTGTVTGQENTGGITGTNEADGILRDNINSGNVTGTEGTTGAVIGKNDNTSKYGLEGNYYQKNDEVNKDLTGVGAGTGVGTDPEGITSGEYPSPVTFEGSGTKEDPYRIYGREDLEKLRDDVNNGITYKNKYFQIENDIDLGGKDNPWTPIGTEKHPFEGIIDGKDHKVSGLYIDDKNADNQGLFGVNAGTIENLTVEGSVAGKDNVGGIAGTNTGSGIIQNCTSGVAVTGTNNVGGIAGKNDGTITGCTNKGTVTGSGSNTGGITGTNEGTVQGNKNTGTVTGSDNTGGITGTNGTEGILKNNINSGNVTNSADSKETTGAVIGKNDNTDENSLSGNYYQKNDKINTDLTGIGAGTGGGKDPAGITSGEDPEPPLFTGSGTKEDPYRITSKEDLEKLRDEVNDGNTYKDKYFRVENDIDLGGKDNPWTPIGTETHPFEGTIDGKGADGKDHKVSGLYIDDKNADNQGLFGVNAGTIENLTVEGSVSGKDNVGGIAGTNTGSGIIQNCTSDVTVTGTNNVGGIAGKNDGTVTGCTNKGDVAGTGSNVGGITGNNGTGGKIKDNINTGNVTGPAGDKSTTGAVIGKNDNKNEGDITGNYYQKTDKINKDLTGIGGVSTDPAGITSGSSPAPGGNTPGTKPGGNTPGTKPGGDTPGTTPGGSKPGGSSSNLTAEQKKQIKDIVNKLGVSKKEAEKIQKVAEKLGIEPEVLLITDKTVTGLKTENDVKGAEFRKLQVKATKVSDKKLTLKWKKVKGADGYLVYGTRCGKGRKPKLIKTLKKSSKTTFTVKKLKKGTPYRYIVRAYKLVGKKKITISVAKTVHIFTSGGKYTNFKSMKVNKAKVSIKKGKTFKLKGKEVKANKKKKIRIHRAVRYESSNKKIATVTKKGVIKGKKKGTCKIYVYAQNGIYKAVKVTVK